jgi:hypothetical protein
MSKVLSVPEPKALQVNNNARAAWATVSADGRGLVSQAGAVLLWETIRVTGLGPWPVAGAGEVAGTAGGA